MHGHMSDQMGQIHIAAGDPFVKDRSAKQPDHVWPRPALHHRFLGERNALVEAGEFERIFDPDLVEQSFGGEIGDLKDHRPGQTAKGLGQSFNGVERHRFDFIKARGQSWLWGLTHGP